MGSGSSKEDDNQGQTTSNVGGAVGLQQDNEPDNYDEIYMNEKDDFPEDILFDEFPSLRNLRFWQAGNASEPQYDENKKLLPTAHCVTQEALKDKEINIEIDEALLTSPLPTLVTSLTSGCKTPADKLLTVYRWFREVETNIPSANDNYAAYYFAKQHKQPFVILELFQKLCEIMEIDCEMIRGHAKGASFARKIADPNLKLREPNHHWLAVALDAHWYLIDLVWCVQQKTDFYFLCDPAIFIFNHFPLKEEWQLLSRPITQQEFSELAFVHKAFYYHELQLLSHPKTLCKHAAGEEVIKMSYNEEKIWSYVLTCEKSGTIVKNVSSMPLEKCVAIEAFRGHVRYTVRFPSCDRYRLDILCQDPQYTATPPSLVCTYVFEVATVLENFSSFPLLETVLWGPTRSTLELGLIPKSHTRGRVLVEESVQISFSSQTEKFLVCTLETEQEVDFDLEQCVIDSYSSETQEVSVNVLLPKTGFYKLIINLEPEKEGGEKTYVVSYLLDCIKPFSQRLVFQNYGDKLGVQSMKKVLQEAIRCRNLHKLRAAVALMKANQLSHKVQEDASIAEDMLGKMEQIDEMKQAIEKTDRGTISEMKNYSKPPQAVHDVLMAAMLVLGDPESSSVLWTDVQRKAGNIGKNSLSRRVRNLNIIYVHPEIAMRATEILARHDIDDLKATSPAAALFFAWVSNRVHRLLESIERFLRDLTIDKWTLNICNEILDRNDLRYTTKPANVKRQKEIFAMIKKGEWPNIDIPTSPEITV